MPSDRPHHPPQPPERGSSSSWRRDTATTTSSSSPMSPARADSSLISFPQLSFLGGLPTSYSHDARKVSPLTSTALSSSTSNPYGLPASMNPGLPASISASTTSTSGDSSASPTSPSWSTWQSILRERDNAARILRGSSLYQGPQTSKEMHQSSSSSTSSHNNPLPLTGRSYRPPSTATMSSDSAAGHGTSSTGTGTGTGTGTWGRSQKSSQTSLRSYPSPSMMLQKLQQEGGGGGGGSSFTHGSSAGGGGRTSTTVDTTSSAPATPNIDESNDEREGESKGAGAAAGPRTSAGPEGVPISPGSEDWSNLLDSPPAPPSTAAIAGSQQQQQQQWQQQGEREPSAQQVQLHLHRPSDAQVEDLANMSTTAKTDTSKARLHDRPPLSPIPGSLSGSDSFLVASPKSSALPATAAASAIVFPQQTRSATAAAARNEIFSSSPAAPPSSSSSPPPTTSPASEERHITAFVHEARQKYKELQALHLAELEGYDRLFESEGVLTAKNGCEQVFMPKPHLSVQRVESDSEEGKRKRSTSSGGGCLGGGDEGKARSPIRAVSFERNRRPTAKSLSALASASTPNLRASSTMHDTTTSSTRGGSRRFTAGQHHRPPPPLPHSAGPILSFSSTTKRLPPLPSSPLPPLGGRARSNSEPRSPTRLLSVEAPPTSDAPGPTTPALDGSSSGSSSESSSLRSSLDLETVLRQGRELEAERQEWRRQFAKSIEGPGFGLATAALSSSSPKGVAGKPTPRPRELMSRYELFQAGPLSPNQERNRSRPRLSRTFSRRVSGDKGGGMYEPIEGSPRRKSFAEVLEEGAARRTASPTAAAGAVGTSGGGGVGGRRRVVSSFLLRHSRSSPHLRDSVLAKERKKEQGGRKVSIQEPTSEGEGGRAEYEDDDGDIVFAPTMCFPPAAGAASRPSAVSPAKKTTTTTSSSTKVKVQSPPRQTKPLHSAPAAATTRTSTTLSPPPNLTSAFDDSLDSSPASRRVSASAKPEGRTSWTGPGSRLLTTLTAADRRKANLRSDETVVIAKKQAQQGGEEGPTTMEGEAKGKEKEIEPVVATAEAATATAASPTSSSPTQTTRSALPRARGSGSGSLSRGSPVARPSEESRSASPPASNRPSTGGASTRKGSSSSAAVRRYAAGGGGSRPSSPPPPHPPPDEPLPALPFAAMGQPPTGETSSKRGTPSPTSSPRRQAKPLGLAISGAPTGASTTVSPSQRRTSRDEPSPSSSSSSTSPSGLLSRVARAALPTGIVPKSPSFRKPVPSMHIEGQEFVLARPGTSSSSGAAKEKQNQPTMPASASSIGMRAHRGSPLPRPAPATASVAGPVATAPTSASRDTAMTRSGTSGSTGNATTTTAEWVLLADQDDERLPRTSSSFDSFAAYRAFLGGPARPESVLEPTTPSSRGQAQQQQQQRSTSDAGRGVGVGVAQRPGRMEVSTQTGVGRDDAAAGGPVRPAGQSTPRRTASAGQPTTATSLSPPSSPYSPTAEMDISEPEVHRSTSPAAAAAAGALRRRGSSRSAGASGACAGGGGGGWHSAASSVMSGETTSAAPPFEMWNADSENVAGEDLFLQRLRSRRSQAEMRRREESGEGAATAAGGEATQGEASSSSPTGGGARRWWVPQQQQQNK